MLPILNGFPNRWSKIFRSPLDLQTRRWMPKLRQNKSRRRAEGGRGKPTTRQRFHRVSPLRKPQSPSGLAARKSNPMPRLRQHRTKLRSPSGHAAKPHSQRLTTRRPRMPKWMANLPRSRASPGPRRRQPNLRLRSKPWRRSNPTTLHLKMATAHRRTKPLIQKAGHHAVAGGSVPSAIDAIRQQ